MEVPVTDVDCCSFVIRKKIKLDKITYLSSGISAVVFSSDVAKLAFIARNYFIWLLLSAYKLTQLIAR